MEKNLTSKYLLALGAHADDIDLRAGATLAKYVADGYSLIYIIVTTSASGIPNMSPNEAITIRQIEAANAAKLYKAEPVFLDFHQCVYPLGPSDKLPQGKPSLALASKDKQSISLVANLLQQYNPAIILTHSPDDLHADHYHTSALVYRAFQKVKESLPSSRLWLWEHGSDGAIIGFFPNRFVQLGEENVALKDQAIKTHASQFARGLWFNSYALDNARYWGKRCNCNLAEAFFEIK